jgi:electron transport complex protein RnfB
VIAVEAILKVLPQTQCTRCGYPDCASYATAIATEEAAINLCPPGGQEGIRRLSQLTGQAIVELDPNHGTEGPRQLAWIDEDWCIGCTLCIDACPADAIIGTHKLMHTVIESECTGCELCIPVCPVDCIHLEIATPHKTGWSAWSQDQADRARLRYEQKQARNHTKEPLPVKVTEDAKSSRLEAALLKAQNQLKALSAK